jgi:hypothetical protein
MKAGGHGIRYTVSIAGQTRYLFREVTGGLLNTRENLEGRMVRNVWAVSCG